MAKKRILQPHEPILHPDHKRPVTRRDFLSAGLIAGGAYVAAPSIFSGLLSAQAHAATPALCGYEGSGGGGIPFMCFDLGGGANMAGSNILIGQQGGQEDHVSIAGFSKLGLPVGMLPTDPGGGINREFGLAMHADSAFLRGMISKTTITTRANVNGAVIPARSDNDTGNNPHNPMYGIAKAGASGALLSLVGSRNSDSGGRSVAPDSMIDLSIRPTQVASPQDATSLVDTGDLGSLMPDTNEAGAVMTAAEQISFNKISAGSDALSLGTPINPADPASLSIQDHVHCGYLKTAYTVTEFGDISAFDPEADINIVGGNGLVDPAPASNVGPVPGDLQSTQAIFSQNEVDNNSTLRKTASVMKLVVRGQAGAGTVESGGYDYHNGTRGTGERRDFVAGQAMGAVLEYAARNNTPVMVYCFTDGSLASNGRLDNTDDGRGKGEWTGDNSSTSAAFFFVYNPPATGGRPVLMGGTVDQQARHQQLGYFRSSASVETNGTTPGANAPNLLAEMCVLNYMALHNGHGQFANLFPNHGLGASTNWDNWIAFNPLPNQSLS